MQVDRNDLIRTLSDLVRINSINPTLVPGAPGGAEIAGYVAGWLGDAGLEILVDVPEPGRPSVAARLKGSGGGRSLMLNAHIEVEVEGRAALLEGGSGLSTYAARSVVRIERRSVPDETEASAVGEIDALLAGLRPEDPTLTISLQTFFSRDSFEIGPDAGIVQTLDAAARTVLAEPPVHMGDTPWMDSALSAGAGIETVVFGPHGTGAHAAEEWVDVESVVQAANVLVATARAWCR